MQRLDKETDGFIERYWQGSLSAEEEMAFEERMMASPDLQRELEVERRLRLGFKDMATEDATRGVVQLSVLATLAQLLRRPRVAWGAALLVLLLALPMAHLTLQNQRLSRQLTAVPSAGPLVDVPLFRLTAVRDGQVPPLAVIPEGGWLSLAVDLPADPRFVDFAVTIEYEGDTGLPGKTVFRRDGLPPNAVDLLLLTFPADFFVPAIYRLRLEGRPADGGQLEVLASYQFEVEGT